MSSIIKHIAFFSRQSLNLIVFILLFFSACTRPVTKIIEPEDKDTILTLIFAGDVMHHLPQLHFAYNSVDDELDYTPVFQFIEPIIKSADFASCNLEAVLGGKPYTGYPMFSAPDEIFYALKETGFDLFQLANNHILDRGSSGLERTITLIDDHEQISVGAYISKEHRSSNYPLIVRLKGIKLGILNFTYGTNGLPTRNPNVVNKIDTLEILKDLKKARDLGAEIIIALPHWGYEYHLYSNTNQKELARFLVENGVDLIVGSHPHVVQEIDLLTNGEKLVPVFYSLGNFISNQRTKHQNGGIMAKIIINIRQKSIQTASVIPFYVYMGKIDNKKNYYILPTSKIINNPNYVDIEHIDRVKLTEHHASVATRTFRLPLE